MSKKNVKLSVGRGEKLPVSKGAGLTAKGREKYNASDQTPAALDSATPPTPPAGCLHPFCSSLDCPSDCFPVPLNECVFMCEETEGIRIDPKLGIGFCHVTTGDVWVMKPHPDGTLIIRRELVADQAQGEWAERASILRKWCVRRLGGSTSRPPQSNSMRVQKPSFGWESPPQWNPGAEPQSP